MGPSKSANSRKASVPKWIGRLPFSPEKKKAAVITHDMELTTIYGIEPHQIRVRKYVSTDKITMGDFTVQPGDYFEPPGYHPADEFYYILDGTATAFNPETGDVHQIKKGETFLIPKGTWHQIYNFGQEDVRILSTSAPVQYTEGSVGSELKEKPKFYRGETS